MIQEKATFAAGCFWGVEAKLAKIPGVIDTMVGYTGGEVENPTYKMVCTNRTGHAEAVQVTFDPDQISYKGLVQAFFELHNPTSVNRQGWDIGSQYRSAIFYHTEEQRKMAEEVKRGLEQSRKYRRSIATEIVPAGEFYRAEEYHQQYYAKQGYHRS
jgi:peptide-methionine (S)-S-oxide reductase